MRLALQRGIARLTWLRPAVHCIRDVSNMTHRQLLDVVRDTRKTLYVVAAFYVIVGFIFAAVSAAAGALLGTFLGFLIISGTLAAAAVLRAVLRTDMHISAVREGILELNERVERLERSLAGQDANAALTTRRSPEDGGADDLVDVAAGKGEPSAIAAATLDRNAFPRLVTLLNEGAEEDGERDRFSLEHQDLAAPDGSAELGTGDADSVARLNVHRQWKRAVRAGDLAAARRAFAAMVDVVDVETRDALRKALADLERRTQRALRQAVNECAARRDVEGLLEVLREIRIQLPGHPMADECAQLERALRSRRAPREAPGGSGAHDAQSDHTGVMADSGTPAPVLRVAHAPS